MLNVAVQIDGRCPLGCRVRRVRAETGGEGQDGARSTGLHIRLSYVAHPESAVPAPSHGATDVAAPADAPDAFERRQTLVCRELADVADHDDPESQMALLKSAVVAAGLVQVKPGVRGAAQLSLAEQLRRNNGGCGLEIETWSALPAGSGLGGSSILSACLLHAIARATGRGAHATAGVLVHDAIHLEAVACDDCGWQDQVGGVIGGVKYTISPPSLPYRVQTHVVPMTQERCRALSEHLTLIYTGEAHLMADISVSTSQHGYASSCTWLSFCTIAVYCSPLLCTFARVLTYMRSPLPYVSHDGGLARLAGNIRRW